MDYDFITTCNWTSTGTFTLRAHRGNNTNVVTSYTLYYRKKGSPTWNSTTNGEIVIDSTGEWEVANNWNKSGNDVLNHSYYNITAINSCTDVYFNGSTLGTTVGIYFLYQCWYGCSSLVSMPEGFNLPQGLTNLGNYFLNGCWYGCSNLVSMPEGFNIPSGVTTIDNNFLYDCWRGCSNLVSMPEGFNIPSGVTTIGDNFLGESWYGCSRLVSMPEGFDIPSGVITIGNGFLYNCWYGCSSLASMPEGFNLPSGITGVGWLFLSSTWNRCTNLTSMPEGFNLPSGITAVENSFLSNTWEGCTNLTSMPEGFNIPSGITTVGSSFFRRCWYNCTNLKQDGYTEDLVFEFDSEYPFAGSCPIVPDSITGASKANPVRVPVNRPEPSPEYSWEVADDYKPNDNTLANVFTEQDYVDVSEEDDVYVETEGEGKLLGYLFKEYNSARGIQPISITWVGKAVLPPDNYREIVLRVYNRRTSEWEILDWKYPSEAGENITLTGMITENLEDYYNDKYTVSFRVIQWVGPLM